MTKRVHLEELLSIAERAARAAAEMHGNARSEQFSIRSKSSPTDVVTDVDRDAERCLVQVIRDARPNDSIAGEEGTNIVGETSVRWVIDPLDGTTNFVYRYPAHAVSVGVEIDGEIALGVVHDTCRDVVYSGYVGGTAKCNGTQISVSTQRQLDLSLVGTGFLADADVRAKQGYVLQQVLPAVRDIRRSGCPSLDLCAVAAGALDGFYEFGLGEWDYCAGAAIVKAAGGEVLQLKSSILPEPLIIAANSTLAESLLSLLVRAGISE